MKIAILGIGTAGIMSLCHTLRWLCPDNSTVTAVYDPAKTILGVGEASQPRFVETLFGATDFNFLDDSKELDATLKLGGNWKNWRKKDFYISLTAPSYAIHFNNFKLKEFCFNRFNEKYKDKFQVLEGSISSLKNNDLYASITVNDSEYKFDYVIDCRGYPTEWDDYSILENSTVNSALVRQVREPGNWNYTFNQATKNGWMFGVPLQTRQGWGYLYNDNITSREEAIDDIKQISGVDELELKEFKFKSYYANSFFDGRILKNGNKALFFEPLEGSAGFFYDTALRYLVDYINGKCSVLDVNSNLLEVAKDSEMFIDFVYHGGSIFNSPFWKYVKENATKKLNKNLKWHHMVENINFYLKHGGEEPPVYTTGRWSIDHWKSWDKKLGYGYFS